MNDLKTQSKDKNSLKKWIILLGSLSLLFFCTTIYFAFFGKPILNQEYCKTVFEKNFLQGELDSLLLSHERIKTEYGEFTIQLSV